MKTVLERSLVIVPAIAFEGFVIWLLFFSIAPISAAIAYLIGGNKRTSLPMTRKIMNAQEKMGTRISDDNLLSEVAKSDERLSETLHYVQVLSGASLAVAESTQYYPSGEDYWSDMLAEMRKAEKYIYLEYFIVEDSVMWGEMTKVMAEKVKSGVDVRFIFDDLGSIGTFSRKDTNKLDALGIKWLAFNEVKYISGTINNRSHRKMMIIDGKVAFSGGVNIADEYINQVKKLGYWKDIGFKITGSAVGEYLYMFMSFWNALAQEQIPHTVLDSVPSEHSTSDGLVLSYYDSPSNRDSISSNFYIEMLGNARKYAWFYTPYLMIGDALQDAVVRAAKRGVDVRIITPGFLHAKASIYDSEICTIGTVNLDYRSLYLNFENNSIFWRSSIHEQLKNDFLETLDKSKEIKEDDLKRGVLGRLLDGVLRIFAPLC